MNGSSWDNFWLGELWHPLRGGGYQAWSGILSDIGEITLIIAVIGLAIKGVQLYHHHFECHEDGCSRHGRYVIEGGIRCCDIHHPALDERPIGKRGHVHLLHAAHLDHLHIMKRGHDE